MADSKLPKHYVRMQKDYPDYMKAVEAVGEASLAAGPLEKPMNHLIQIAAAAAIHSMTSVKSHTRRALAAGATMEQVRHALLLCTSTLGFPRVQTAVTWAEEAAEK
jgi:alkylhydroperoxidase/carboxymuconolactone decarboxylase family protein YurZ